MKKAGFFLLSFLFLSVQSYVYGAKPKYVSIPYGGETLMQPACAVESNLVIAIGMENNIGTDDGIYIDETEKEYQVFHVKNCDNCNLKAYISEEAIPMETCTITEILEGYDALKNPEDQGIPDSEGEDLMA